MSQILIVDDTKLNRKLMKKLLSKFLQEIEFYEAADGVKALEIIEKNNIDLVILDLMMPNKDGYEVLKELKESERSRDIPVIVNSAITDMESIKKTLSLGAIDYFTKPMTPEEMEIIIPLKAKNALRYYEQTKKINEINEKNETELKIAGVLQRSILDSYKGKHFSQANVYAKYKLSEQLGGDLFKYVEKDGKGWFIIADMTGQGVATAMMSSMLNSIFNVLISKLDSPVAVMKEINQTFCQMMADVDYICFSAFIGMIHENQLTYCNGGHPYPILFRDNGDTKLIDLTGNLVGIFEEADYKQETIEVEKGDCLFLCTDGLYGGKKLNKHMDTNEINKKIVGFYNKADCIPDFLDAVYNGFSYEEDLSEQDVSIMSIEIK